jgi:hypothetical protein
MPPVPTGTLTGSSARTRLEGLVCSGLSAWLARWLIRASTDDLPSDAGSQILRRTPDSSRGVVVSVAVSTAGCSGGSCGRGFGGTRGWCRRGRGSAGSTTRVRDPTTTSRLCRKGCRERTSPCLTQAVCSHPDDQRFSGNRLLVRRSAYHKFRGEPKRQLDRRPRKRRAFGWYRHACAVPWIFGPDRRLQTRWLERFAHGPAS